MESGFEEATGRSAARRVALPSDGWVTRRGANQSVAQAGCAYPASHGRMGHQITQGQASGVPGSWGLRRVIFIFIFLRVM
jgi:hypothetical protein